MPDLLTPAMRSQYPLLYSLAEHLPAFSKIKEKQAEGHAMHIFLNNLIQKTVAPAVDKSDFLADFDRQTVQSLPHVFMAHGLINNMTDFFELQSLVFLLRRQLLIQRNLSVPEPVLTTHQARIISPDKEAYDMMGNNLLNIEQSKNSYSLIYE